jgi:hypothetical protein
MAARCTMAYARPSAIAVLPTPGSPRRMGLFLERRARICITRPTSCSRPNTFGGGGGDGERAGSCGCGPGGSPGAGESGRGAARALTGSTLPARTWAHRSRQNSSSARGPLSLCAGAWQGRGQEIISRGRSLQGDAHAARGADAAAMNPLAPHAALSPHRALLLGRRLRLLHALDAARRLRLERVDVHAHAGGGGGRGGSASRVSGGHHPEPHAGRRSGLLPPLARSAVPGAPRSAPPHLTSTRRARQSPCPSIASRMCSGLMYVTAERLHSCGGQAAGAQRADQPRAASKRAKPRRLHASPVPRHQRCPAPSAP